MYFTWILPKATIFSSTHPSIFFAPKLTKLPLLALNQLHFYQRKTDVTYLSVLSSHVIKVKGLFSFKPSFSSSSPWLFLFHSSPRVYCCTVITLFYFSLITPADELMINCISLTSISSFLRPSAGVYRLTPSLPSIQSSFVLFCSAHRPHTAPRSFI